ncbi:hypothetical protein HAX54_003321 [Datura stramonium]|uniref:Uncharacterized protein n=1 Tax=Datura stramonium TaxID=4076 RepID=A0ABS8T7D1_DATST|nr:hypothetical protein [Datura stramonium]
MGSPERTVEAQAAGTFNDQNIDTTLNIGIVTNLNFAAVITTPIKQKSKNPKSGDPNVKDRFSSHNGMPSIIFKASDYYGVMIEECRYMIVGKFIRSRPNIDRIQSRFTEKDLATEVRNRPETAKGVEKEKEAKNRVSNERNRNTSDKSNKEIEVLQQKSGMMSQQQNTNKPQGHSMIAKQVGISGISKGEEHPHKKEKKNRDKKGRKTRLKTRQNIRELRNTIRTWTVKREHNKTELGINIFKVSSKRFLRRLLS